MILPSLANFPSIFEVSSGVLTRIACCPCQDTRWISVCFFYDTTMFGKLSFNFWSSLGCIDKDSLLSLPRYPLDKYLFFYDTTKFGKLSFNFWSFLGCFDKDSLLSLPRYPLDKYLFFLWYYQVWHAFLQVGSFLQCFDKDSLLSLPI